MRKIVRMKQCPDQMKVKVKTLNGSSTETHFVCCLFNVNREFNVDLLSTVD